MQSKPPFTPPEVTGLLMAQTVFNTRLLGFVLQLAKAGACVPEAEIVRLLRSNVDDSDHPATRLPFEQWADFFEGGAEPRLTLIRGGLSEVDDRCPTC